MANYYVNKNAQPSSGDHEVHTTGCPYPPDQKNRIPLGNFSTCHGAVREAKKLYKKADGCGYCCPDCHTS